MSNFSGWLPGLRGAPVVRPDPCYRRSFRHGSRRNRTTAHRFFQSYQQRSQILPAAGNIRIEGSVGGGSAEIRISDFGIGIAAADLPHIFDKYYRAHGNKTGGAGLGLYLVKQIIELHGGTVSVQSVPDQGTTIVIRLPLAG